MVYINFNAFFALSTLASLVSAAPVHMQKRIAQSIAESTAQWEQACVRLISPYGNTFLALSFIVTAEGWGRR